MSNLSYRKSVVLKANSSVATSADFAGSYTVTAYSVGAVADGAQTGVSEITVHAGHGIATGDKFMVGTDATTFLIAGTVTATTVPLSSGTVTVADDDLIVNLGADTGSSSPVYDGSKFNIYSDNNGSTAYSNSLVTCDATGEYVYWHKGDGANWELIRDGNGNPIEVRAGTTSSGSVNSIDYGASGGADDSGAIQAAITAIQGTGKTLLVAQDATLTSKITIASSMRLLCDGSTMTLAPGSGSIASGILVTGSDVTLEGRNGGGFSGSKDVSANDNDYDTIRCDDSVATVDNFRVVNAKVRLTITNTGTSPFCSAIRIYGVNSGNGITGPRVDGCDVVVTAPDVDSSHKWYGIYFYGFYGSGDNTRSITNAVAGRNHMAACVGRNIQMFSVDGGLVSGNIISNLGDGQEFGTNGIRILGCQGVTVANNYIEKNADAYGQCIYMAGSSGYTTETWSDHCSVIGNTIVDNATVNNATDLYIDGCRHLLVQGNSISATKPTTGLANHYGIRVEDVTFSDTPNSYISVVGNHIWGFGGTAGFAIRVDSSQTGPVVIVGNDIHSGPNNSNHVNDLWGSSVVAGNAFDGNPVVLGPLKTLADDATPSVVGGAMWTTGGTTTITDFDDGIIGQTITIKAAHSLTITHNSSNIDLSGDANFGMVSGDTLTLTMFTSGVWSEVGRRKNPTSSYTPTNVVPDRAYDADSTTTEELADVLGTLIADLQSHGVLG